MDILSAIAEVVRILIEGGGWAEIQAADGFRSLVGLSVWLIPPTIIALGIGMTEWHETPLGVFMGARRPEKDNWAERARDLDKDGLADF